MELSKIKQRLELLYQEVKELEASGGGGEPVDAYTKAQSDDLFETKAHAGDTYQTKSAMSAYATTEWVGEQGFLTDADEVPDVGSTDNGKVLTATYSEGTGSYSWETPSSTAQVQADWTEADSADPSYIKNKPDLSDMATKTWVGQQNYLTSSDISDMATKTWVGNQGYLTSSDLSGYATQTWVGQQGFLTSADEVPDVGSGDDGKVLTATYSGGTGSYSWETIPTPSVDEVPDVGSTDDGKVLTATYSGGQGSYAWATPASGGLTVETDGTNYWITVNGIRLYFASSAPTGTIPDGSYGIGW